MYDRLGFAALAILGLLVGCQRVAPPLATPTPPEVLVATPIEREVTEYVDFTGRTEAVNSVEIRARVTGYLVDVHFDEGADVKEGDLLYQIDPRPFEAEVERAVAEKERWQAQLAKAVADLARAKTLRASNVVSQEEFDTTIAAEGIAKANLAGADAAIKQARLNLEFTRITSPIAGRVGRTSITKGNLVSATVGGSNVLTTIVAQDPMYVLCDIDEQTLLRHQEYLRQKGDVNQVSELRARKIPAFVGLGNQSGYPHRGVLDFGDNRVDATTGTIKVRAVLDNKERNFQAGMFARVRLPFGDPHSALLVPGKAILADQGQRLVLVVNAENVVEVRPVKLGPEDAGQRVIESGLKPSERVIVAGMQNVRPGITVQPRVAEPAAASTASPATAAETQPAQPAAPPEKK